MYGDRGRHGVNARPLVEMAHSPGIEQYLLQPAVVARTVQDPTLNNNPVTLILARVCFLTIIVLFRTF